MTLRRAWSAGIALGVVLATACCPSRDTATPEPGDEKAAAPSPPETQAKPKPTAAPPKEGAEADAPEAAAKERRLWIDAARVDCEGSAPRKCLRVKDAADAEWSLFYSDIAGFEYEEGFVYELRVEVKSVSNAPADGSTLAYRLVEVVSKEAAPKATP